MSKWLVRALAADAYRSAVPIAPKVPIAEPELANGTNGTNGTALIYTSSKPPVGAGLAAPEYLAGGPPAGATPS
jgi:hypothetical protein